MGPISVREAKEENKPMKQGILKKSIPLPVVLVIAMVAVGGIAQLLYYYNHDVSTSMTILATYGVEILDEVGETLTNIAFGDFYRGEMEIFPGDPGVYLISNVGEDSIYIYFTVTGVPTDGTIRLQQDYDNDGSYTNWDTGNWLMLIGNTAPYAIPSGGTVAFKVYVKAGATSPFGNFSPVITLTASDAPEHPTP